MADNFEFLESKNKAQSASEYEPTPYDYQDGVQKPIAVDVENDPFAEFGDSVSIDDNFLE